MGKSVIGIDIGGTHFRIGVVTGNGEVREFRRLPTAQVIRSNDVLSDLAAFIDGYRSGMEVEAAAIGFPATLDKNRRTVLQAPNLPFMENLPVVSFLTKQLRIPVFAERDVTFALRYDMGKYHIPSEGIVCGFYFGTGIGNAISINGQPLLGKNGVAGELGHIPVDGSEMPCGCGNTGCLENLAGGKYLAGLQKERYPHTDIGQLFQKHGDEPLLRQFVDRMAAAAAVEVNILDPDHILIGGGVVNMAGFPKKFLSERLIVHTRKPYPAAALEITYTGDEPEKCVVGAAYYTRDRVR